MSYTAVYNIPTLRWNKNNCCSKTLATIIYPYLLITNNCCCINCCSSHKKWLSLEPHKTKKMAGYYCSQYCYFHYRMPQEVCMSVFHSILYEIYCCNVFFPYHIFWWYGSWKFYISRGKIMSDNLIICSNDFKSSKKCLNQEFVMWNIALKKNGLNFVVMSVFSDFNNKTLNPSILLNYFAMPIISPSNKKTFQKLLRGSLTHIKKRWNVILSKKIMPWLRSYLILRLYY